MPDLIGFMRGYLPEAIKAPLRRSWQACSNLAFTPQTVEVGFFGDRFWFYLDNRQAQQWYGCSHAAETAELRFYRDRLVRKGDLILEAGAHHGFATICLSRLVGEAGRVVAFEPLAKNADALRKNLQLNRIENVEVHVAAVGRSEGELVVTGDTNSRVTDSRWGVPCRVLALDSFADLRPDLLKIDVEGYEIEVLRGAQRILSMRPKLGIEIHTETLSNFKTTLKDLNDLLPLEDYRVWLDRGDGRGPVAHEGPLEIDRRCHIFGLPK